MLQKAQTAKEQSTDAEIEEEIRLAWNKVYSDAYLNNYTPEQKAQALKDELGNDAELKNDNVTVEYRSKTVVITELGEMYIKGEMKTITSGQKAPEFENAKYISGDYTAIIPAGFTVSNVDGEKEIETGLVVRDDSGNEFVWIPIEIPWKSDSTKRIQLKRYEFNTKGSPSDYSGGYVEEESTNLSELKDYGNTIAKNIKYFISRTNSAGGFYIGRYEARKSISGKLTENKTDDIWGNITQQEAAFQSVNMYSNTCFESDLINSYAWDTATLFLQEYDNRLDRSIIFSRSKGKEDSLVVKGLTTDLICNVYEMASNYGELTTETSDDSNKPCVFRGGWRYYNGNDGFVSLRSKDTKDYSGDNITFRPILYIK